MMHLYTSQCDFYIFLTLENVEVYGTKQPSNQPGHGPNMADSPLNWAYVDSPTLPEKTGLFFESLRCEFQVLGLWHEKEHRPTGGFTSWDGRVFVENAFEKLLQGNTFALTQDKPILRWYTLLGTSPYPTYRGGTSYLDPTTFKGDCSGMLSRSPPKIDHGIPCQHEHRSQWGSMKMHETL